MRIRRVNVRRDCVVVAGHTVKQELSYEIAEAESVHGMPFGEELDKYIQMGMFAINRISADGTLHKVASAKYSVQEGRCVRAVRINHCEEIEPESATWRVIQADGSEVVRERWSCVSGTLPKSHEGLMPDNGEHKTSLDMPDVLVE